MKIFSCLIEPVKDGSNLLDPTVNLHTSNERLVYARGAQKIVTHAQEKISACCTFQELLEYVATGRRDLQMEVKGDAGEYGVISEATKPCTLVYRGRGKYSQNYGLLEHFLQQKYPTPKKGAFRAVVALLNKRPVELNRVIKIEDDAYCISYTDEKYRKIILAELERLWGVFSNTTSGMEKMRCIASIDGILLRARLFTFGGKAIADFVQEILIRQATHMSFPCPQHGHCSRDFSAFCSEVLEYIENWLNGRFWE